MDYCPEHFDRFDPYDFDEQYARQWCRGCLADDGSIIAWRMWMPGPPLGRRGDYLYGPGGHGGYHRRWDSAEMIAVCVSCTLRQALGYEQPIPSMDHSCGIHASLTLADLLTHPDVQRDILARPQLQENVVLGRVRLSGLLRPGVEKARVIRGARGRMLGPLYLCGFHHLAGRLAARYDVEVIPIQLDVESWTDGVFRFVSIDTVDCNDRRQ